MVREKVVLTSYFTTKEDPQKGKKRSAEEYSMMGDWYESLHRLDINGIIFHDHLSDDFIDKYSTDQLKFVEVELGNRSVNDERFYFYSRYLKNHDIDKVIMTDLFDVEFKCNPFELMNGNYKLYMGNQVKVIDEEYWEGTKFDIQKYLPWVVYPEGYKECRVLNDGSIGGNKEIIIKMLEQVNDYFDRLPPALNANMPVWNLVVRSEFDDNEIMHGEPWNSEFTGYENEGNFCIRHK